VTHGREASATFACFGSTCSVFVTGPAGDRSAQDAVDAARERLLAWHDRFTRFHPDSELSRLNADPRAEVAVSADMATVVAAALDAARATGGLVDPTLVDEIEAAGYDSDLADSLPPAVALALAPARGPAAASPARRWTQVAVDHASQTVTRPPGVRLDPGGIAKGVFADLLAHDLAGHAAFAVDCAGDVRVGGTTRVRRAVDVADPFGRGALHTFGLVDGGAATSGIGRRSWLGADGRAAHHLLDPATGRPAYTGIVQATALAATAGHAEALAKAAVLAGPASASRWLAGGGVVVFDDGSHELVAPPRRRVISSAALSRLAAPALRT
jgi:FAD:protein FMN transferase